MTNILNTKCNAYRNANDIGGVPVTLNAVIKRIRDGDRGLKSKTFESNRLARGDKDTYRVYKAKFLPAVTFSGTFPKSKRKAQHISRHSGLITLDIDGLSADIIPDLLATFAQMPEILLAFVSPSGVGIKVIVRVDPIPIDANDHKGAYAACVESFEDLATEYEFEIDKSGSDCSRMCFLAHDPLAIVHDNAVAIEWDRETWQLDLESRENKQSERAERNTQYEGDIDVSALEYIKPDPKTKDFDYDTWVSVGFACYDAGVPCEVWDNWSEQGSGYKPGECALKWQSFGNGYGGKKITWGSVVHLAKENGYETPQRPGKAKLKRKASIKTPVESLEDNRANREASTDAFLSEDTDSTAHILLIKDGTGTGKTHTILAKARQHEKRPLAQLPHTELASQAVDVAFEMGFKNPFHILGRAHNWDESGIANIPVENRTQDLFEKNNCIMWDQVEAYTDNRLAPRTYCEHKCPFREGCPHLAQYEGLGQRDFVATCTPNLLFDLNMRGYLQSLVSATDEPSAEELAIDAILGTTSEEMEVFDLAILDDYSVSGLYTDITFSECEFKEIKKAWIGTPTGDFANLMLKAFKKKKPQKIVKALRTAFESTEDNHTEIAKDLTQHARMGIVEYASQPKGSKETSRLLSEKIVRYSDGGKQFVPADFDAYSELKEKGVPTVHPQHLQTHVVGEQVRVPHTPVNALIAGVPVEELTPVWQKGATPIELLDIFLKSVGNDKNAPINRSFRTGDPPVAVLDFSIPPQAPVGVISRIAMLSATTEPAGTKQAFEGQSVTFSEHEGGHLEWAEGVQVYQFQDARLTSASVFEYPTDTAGKRKLQELPIGLTQTAENRLRKLNDWAKEVDGLTAFISYKEFTEDLGEAVNGFDIVTHFDKVAGLNFDGLKYLVVFGYPKVKHEVVMEQARKQFASDSEPIPKGSYEELTQTADYDEDGITITENRYKDSRLEKIRRQLAIEKLEQAIGRARIPVWTDTTTIIFTDAPVAGITERSTLFSSGAFNLAGSPRELTKAMDKIQHAADSGDVEGVMDTNGVSQRHAYNLTKHARNQQKADRDIEIVRRFADGQSKKQIAAEMILGQATVKRVLDSQQF